jgi:hypothetical protein
VTPTVILPGLDKLDADPFPPTFTFTLCVFPPLLLLLLLLLFELLDVWVEPGLVAVFTGAAAREWKSKHFVFERSKSIGKYHSARKDKNNGEGQERYTPPVVG